jgi:uncharacterized membrane protein YqjE
VRRYVVRRLLATVASLLAVATLVFVQVERSTPSGFLDWRIGREPSNLFERFASRLWGALFPFATATAEAARLEDELSAALWRSLFVGLFGVAVAVGIGCLVWLVLHARLPRWAETATAVACAVVASATCLWLLPAVQHALPPELGSSGYYIHWPQPGFESLSQSWMGVVRAGLLVGLALGGAAGLAVFLVSRHLTRGPQAASGGSPAVRSPAGGPTGRQVWARVLGVWWPLQVAVSFAIVGLVLLAEGAATYEAGFAALFEKVRSPLLAWYVAADAWQALLSSGFFVALALGLATVALDPALAAAGERPADAEAVSGPAGGGADAAPEAGGSRLP